MDHWEFLKWRRTLGYTQDEAGQKLGVSRGTIQHWERGSTRIPRVMEMACRELTRRWKQRPGFGPVSLVYSDGQDSYLRCEPHVDNEAAIERALHLSARVNFINPHIMADGACTIWTTEELLGECARRRQESRRGGAARDESDKNTVGGAPTRRPM